MAAVRFPKLEVVLSQMVGMHIDFHLLERMTSLNLNPKVDFRLYGCHL